ncbi:CopG family antitoxin [Fluviispira sanaruensis]|uniref:Uncharacterized protein n=1 Tax=Fluviispira sanaruensis TaxID=2493639 RepID=A0A4P2VP96_FLUSA|nr:CopG family antitoxin [Fluviispira sanaruensis]BBH53970.1 hypothetical protein JCM31447_24230 [Fluviispira sanaruensis]
MHKNQLKQYEEKFNAEGDISEFMKDPDFEITTIEFEPKTITVRLSDPLLNYVQSFAKKDNVS